MPTTTTKPVAMPLQRASVGLVKDTTAKKFFLQMICEDENANIERKDYLIEITEEAYLKFKKECALEPEVTHFSEYTRSRIGNKYKSAGWLLRQGILIR